MFSIAHSPGNWMTMSRIGLLGRAYPMTAKLSDQANSTRDLAKRARRLATTLTVADDVARLIRYAEELEAEAHDLEKRARDGA